MTEDNIAKVYILKTFTDRFTNNEYYPGWYPVKYLEAKIPDILKDSVLRTTYIREDVSMKNVNKVPNTFTGNLPKNTRYIEQLKIEDNLEVLNINKISYEDLIKITGIGDKSARKILNKIAEKPFNSLEELNSFGTNVDWSKYNIIFE